MASETSNSPLGIRSVEWLRNNGAAGLVAQVESIYYTLTAPSKGGPTLRALPKVGYGAAAARPGRPSTPKVARARRIADPSRTAGRGRLARDPPEPRIRAADPLDDAARPTRIPARRRGTRVDRHPAHEAHAQPWPAGALRAAPAWVDGRRRRWAPATAGDVQQRLQAERLPRRLRRQRTHLRADARRSGRRSSATKTGTSTSSTGATARRSLPASPSHARTCP